MTISYLDALAEAYGKTFARYVEKSLMPKYVGELSGMSQGEIDTAFETIGRQVAIFESDTRHAMAREDCADMYAQYAAIITLENRNNAVTINDIFAELD